MVRAACATFCAEKMGDCRDRSDGVIRAERVAVRKDKRLRVILAGTFRDILMVSKLDENRVGSACKAKEVTQDRLDACEERSRMTNRAKARKRSSGFMSAASAQSTS